MHHTNTALFLSLKIKFKTNKDCLDIVLAKEEEDLKMKSV